MISVITGVILACIFESAEGLVPSSLRRDGGLRLVLCVLLGGQAQLGIQLPSLWGLGFRFKWQLDFRNPALPNGLDADDPERDRGFGRAGQRPAVNSAFASHIDGAMSWLYYAFRLVQLPIGIFGVAIATVTLPAVARQHALDDLKAFGKTVEDALRFGFYLTLPASDRTGRGRANRSSN